MLSNTPLSSRPAGTLGHSQQGNGRGDANRRHGARAAPPGGELLICDKAIRILNLGMVRVAMLRDELCDPGLPDPDSIIGELQARRLADVFNFRQQLPDTAPQFPFPFEWDNLAVLDVVSYEHWWNSQIRNDGRRMVRKAEKNGINVRVVEFDDRLVAGIKRIWDETPFRQGRIYRYYKHDLDTVRRENSTFLERAQLIGAFYHGELVGFDKVFYTGERADHIHIVSLVALRDKSPTNAMLAKSVELAAQRGARYMTYGKFAYGKKGEDSMSGFKRRNGFHKVEIPRYFVPLTARGRLALRLGLHKGLKEALPASCVRFLSRARICWSKLALQFVARPPAQPPQ